MKYYWLSATAAGVVAAVAGLIFDPEVRFIWNRTGSAPEGLYRLSHDAFIRGAWVIVSAHSDETNWARMRGYVGKDWPLIKQIAGVPDDEICRDKNAILINGIHVATALEVDSLGRHMPVWNGCGVLGEDEVFLLNSHPRSIDGRYFGPTNITDIGGTLRLLWSLSEQTTDISVQGGTERGQEF